MSNLMEETEPTFGPGGGSGQLAEPESSGRETEINRLRFEISGIAGYLNYLQSKHRELTGEDYMPTSLP